jgi:rhodanese-related sulfurtransferase
MTTPISRQELRRLLAAGSVTVVDALPETYWAEQHLPGAVNLVDADVAQRAGVLLPDRHATVVTYSADSGCKRARAVAVKLQQLGYTDVRTYRDGIQDWVAAGLPTVGEGLPDGI